jgi:WD40 repeat protein
MQTMTKPHPTAELVVSYGQGLLSPEEAARVEEHLTGCDTCCRHLEAMPADSFVACLRRAGSAAGTTIDLLGGTLADVTEVPAELLEHPRYRVLALLGHGGMGAVYRAEHRRMERLVALKVIHPGLLRNNLAVERFHQEVRAAALLQHPNIVTAHDADTAGSLHFLVMEHVEGITLWQQVTLRGRLRVREACDCIYQAALGLQHAHEKGMVHRDIKPHNLMRTPEGVVKILDFGLARLARVESLPEGETPTDSSLTAAGSIMGSADYIAPEQATDPRTADIRADIYSLGCTLYTLLTGSVPFPEGSIRDKIAAHQTRPVPVPRRLPAGLAAILRRMTAKDPAARYATPAEVAAALKPFTKPARPRRHLVLTAAIVVLAIFVGVKLLSIFDIRMNTERGEITVRTDDDALEVTTRQGQVLRIRDTRTGQLWVVNGRDCTVTPGDEKDSLSIQLPERGTLILARRGGKETLTITTGVKQVPALARTLLETASLPSPAELARRASPADDRVDGVTEEAHEIVTGRPLGRVPELVTVLGDPRWHFINPANHPIADAQVSPDGQYLGILLDGQGTKVEQPLWVFDRRGREVRGLRSTLASAKSYRSFAFTQDGWLLVQLGDSVQAVDLESGKTLGKIDLPQDTFPAIVPMALAARRDGEQHILYVGHPRKGEVHAFDLKDGAKLDSWPVRVLEGVARLSASPKGNRLRVESKAGRVMVIDTTKAVLVKLPAEGIDDVVFGDDGSILAYREGRNVTFPTVDSNGPVHFQVGGTVSRMLLSPKDKFAAAAESVRFVSLLETLADGNPGSWSWVSWSLTGPNGFGLLPSWKGKPPRGFPTVVARPDGGVLAIDSRGRIRPLMADGKDVELLQPEPADGFMGAIRRLAFSPDGKFLVTEGPRQELSVWNLATGERLLRADDYLPQNTPRAWTFTPDGKHLAFIVRGGPTEELDLLDLATGKVDKHAGPFNLSPEQEKELAKDRWSLEKSAPDPVMEMAFSPDGTLLATVAVSGQVYVRRFENRQLVGQFRMKHPPDEPALAGRGQHPDHIAFTPGGRYLVTSSTPAPDRAMNVIVWDLATGQEMARASIEKAVSRTPFTFLPDGRSLAVAQTDGTLHIWDWVADRHSSAGVGLALGMFTSATIGPGGGLFAGLTAGGLLVRAATADGAPDRTLPVTHGTTVAVSPEGRYVAVGRADGTTALFRLAERGKLGVRPLEPLDFAERSNPADAFKSADITAAARQRLAPDSKLSDKVVAVLGDARFRLDHDSTIEPRTQPTYSPDGRYLLVQQVASFQVFDARTGLTILSRAAPDKAFGFTPDSTTLLILRDDMEVWDLATGKLVRTLPLARRLGLLTAALSHDGERLALAYRSDNDELFLRLTEASTGKLLRSELLTEPVENRTIVERVDTRTISALAFAPGDGSLVVRAQRDAEPRFSRYDARTLQRLDTGDPYSGLSFRSDGSVLARWTGAAIEVLDPEGKVVRVIRANKRAERLSRFVRTADGLLHIVAVESSGLGRFALNRVTFDPETGKERGRTHLPLPDGPGIFDMDAYEEEVVLAPTVGSRLLFGSELTRSPRPIGRDRWLTWSPDGTTLAAFDEDGWLRLWDIGTGKVVESLQTGVNFRPIFNPDSKRLALVDTQDGKIQLVRRGELGLPVPKPDGHYAGNMPPAQPDGHALAITDAAFSPDGALLATIGKDYTVRLWSSTPVNPSPITALAHSGRMVLGWSPDGRKLAFAGSGGLSLWDRGTKATGTCPLGPSDPDPRRPAHAVAIRPDGREALVVTEQWGLARVPLDAPDGGKEPAPVTGLLKPDEETVLAARIDPTCRRIAYLTRKRLLVWQPESSGTWELPFPRPGRASQAIAFSPEGRYVAVGTQDGLIAIVRLSERGKVPELPSR